MRCWKPGSRLDGAGFSGDGFLAMPSDHLRGVEGRTEDSGPLQVLDVAERHATRRHHDDTSMHWPIRYTFYQRAIREQEGPTELLPPCYLGACLGISIQVTSMDDQSVQVASIRPQCLFAPIPAA